MSKVEEMMALVQEYGNYHSAWDRLPNEVRKSVSDETLQEVRNAIEAAHDTKGVTE